MIFAAIDWAEQSHMLVVLDAEGKTVDKARIGHDRTGLGGLGRMLLGHGIPAAEVSIAVELNEGVLVDWLLWRGSVKRLQRLRKRHRTAGRGLALSTVPDAITVALADSPTGWHRAVGSAA